MKTVKQIHKDEEALREQLRESLFGRSPIRRKLEFLRICRYYLDTAPREGFIDEQLAHCKYRLNILQRRYGSWAKHKPNGHAALKREYEALNDLPRLRAHIKALEYLLDDC